MCDATFDEVIENKVHLGVSWHLLHSQPKSVFVNCRKNGGMVSNNNWGLKEVRMNQEQSSQNHYITGIFFSRGTK